MRREGGKEGVREGGREVKVSTSKHRGMIPSLPSSLPPSLPPSLPSNLQQISKLTPRPLLLFQHFHTIHNSSLPPSLLPSLPPSFVPHGQGHIQMPVEGPTEGGGGREGADGFLVCFKNILTEIFPGREGEEGREGGREGGKEGKRERGVSLRPHKQYKAIREQNYVFPLPPPPFLLPSFPPCLPPSLPSLVLHFPALQRLQSPITPRIHRVHPRQDYGLGEEGEGEGGLSVGGVRLLLRP